MKQIFTQNDLLRYIYKELSPVEEKLLEHQLHTDNALSNEYSNLLDGIALLEQAEISPTNTLLQSLRNKLHLNEEEHSV